MNTGSPVSDAYASPNSYTGILKKVDIHLEPLELENGEVGEIGRTEHAVQLALQ
jgi:hypothetical protein